MASTISVLDEPELVNLVVRALNPDYLLLDIFLHLRSETWTQCTIEAARVKVHHRPYSFFSNPSKNKIFENNKHMTPARTPNKLNRHSVLRRRSNPDF